VTDTVSEPGQVAEALGRLVGGFRVTQAVHVMSALGIPDLVADGPRTSDELAEATGADPDALYRLLRAAASLGLLHEDDARGFGATPLSELLRSDVPGSMKAWVDFVGTPYYWESWGNLLHSVRTGENAFRHVHGIDVWGYRAQHPGESEAFDRAMAALTSTESIAFLDTVDLSHFGTLVDVGGGQGVLLAAALARYPEARGVLFDQPHVVEAARTVIAEAGVADRCELVGGDFFAGVPEADAHLLKWILHDWEDAECVTILERCRASIAADGALYALERDVGKANEDPQAKLSDLNMLVMPGGRERTADEYAALFERAGFELVSVSRTATGTCVFEGAPV
jgi:hypothetical protein